MELQSYLTILWRRIPVIGVTIAITVLVVILGIGQMEPMYVASATIRVTPANGAVVDYGELLYLERLMNTYAQLVTSGPVLEEARQQLGLAKSLPTLRKRIAVKFPANTELMQIIVEDQQPANTAAIANTLANILVEQSKTTRVGRSYSTSLVDPAVAPQKPDKPRNKLLLTLAAVVGLAGGLGLAFLFEHLDTRLHTINQIHTATHLTPLGKIPTFRGKQRTTFQNGNSPAGEAFRFLRTNMFALQADMPQRTILVTSAEPHEGKSTILANLAFTVAQSGKTVVAVDGDLRVPTLHRHFGLANESGLSDVLRQEKPLEAAIQASDVAGMHMLPSGPSPAHPTELLASPQMAVILKQLAERYDMVLLDTPAFLATADAATLVPLVDGVLLVVRRAQTQQEAVETVCQQLTQLKARLIGVIVNRAEQDGNYDFYRRVAMKQGK